MKKLLLMVLLTGCLNTQNKHIEMKSHPTGVPTINSGLVIEVNPKNSDERDVEYFESHNLRWPDSMPNRSSAPKDAPTPKIEKETSGPY